MCDIYEMLKNKTVTHPLSPLLSSNIQLHTGLSLSHTHTDTESTKSQTK